MPTTTDTEKLSRTCLFVRKIPLEATQQDLETFFSEVGPIRSCFLVLEKPNEQGERQHRGMGFVHFALSEDAKRALEELADVKFLGKRKLAIEFAMRKSDPKELKEKVQINRARLIVRNLSFKCTQETLKLKFEPFGTILSCSIPISEGKPRGFGFVEFQKSQDAENAIKELNGTQIDNREIAVDWCLSKDSFNNLENKTVTEPATEQETQDEFFKEEPVDLSAAVEDETTIFIRNLAFTSTEQEVLDMFSVYGKIRYARITMDHETGLSKGTAFVCFYDRKDTEKCLEDYAKAQFRAPKKSLIAPEPLQNASENAFILGDRFLNIALAVTKKTAQVLAEQNSEKKRALDKRNLYLMKEGVIFPESDVAKSMKPTEVSRRYQSFVTRKKLLEKNPNLFISKTRLSVRNLSPKIDDKQLKQAAISAIKEFWDQVEAKTRNGLEKDVYDFETAEKRAPPSKSRKIIVKQVKIMRDEAKIDPVSKKGKSKGYAFIEFESHADALCCLRCLNNNPSAFGPENKMGPIVEFSVENRLILEKRKQRQSTTKTAANAKEAKPQKNSVDKKSSEKKNLEKKSSEKKAVENKPLEKKTAEKPVKRKAQTQEQETKAAKKTKTAKPNKKKEKSDDFDDLLKTYKSNLFKTREDESNPVDFKRWFAE